MNPTIRQTIDINVQQIRPVVPTNHLMLSEIKLAPGAEWTTAAETWLLVRVAGGNGYWNSEGYRYQSAEPNDAVLLFPSAKGSFLASQIGEATLQGIPIDLGLLTGVMTLQECRALTSHAQRNKQKVMMLPAAGEISKRIAELCEGRQPNKLVSRLKLLEIFAELVGDGLEGETSSEVDYVDSRARFRLLIQQMPEAQLMRSKVSELAKKLSCSQRHFSRLFREEVGMSLRENQKRLRLEHARHLLEKSSDKIIDIALEAGYSSLSLFNVMFKSRYKMTPSEWRSEAQLKKQRTGGGKAVVRILLVLPLLTLGLGRSVLGQAAPEAGAKPVAESAAAPTASAPAATPKFLVRGYRVFGNTLLPVEVLRKTLEPHTGEAVDFETIRKGLSALILEYRDRGYATVGVSLPQQELKDGVVNVDVTEGRLAEIRVEGNRHFSSNNVMRSLPSLQTNIVLNSRIFQAELDASNGNRDRQIYPQIQPGVEPGTSTLVLRVEERFPLHGRIEWSNHRTAGTPEWRLNSSAQYNNLWQLDHSTGLQYGFTPERFKREHEGRPSLGIDHPLIAYYNAYYRLPLGAPRSAAERVAAQPGVFGYNEATRQFLVPPPSNTPELYFFANRSTTDSSLTYTEPRVVVQTPVTTIGASDSRRDFSVTESVGFRVNQPLWQGASRASLSGGFDLRHYDAKGYSTNIFGTVSVIPPANPSDPPQVVTGETQSGRARHVSLTYLPLVMRGDLSIPDKTGQTSLGLGATYSLPLDPFSSESEFETVSGSAESGSSFSTFTAGVTRDQSVYKGWRVLLRSEGQYSTEPVFSNEQFSAGGASSVRGYFQGESFGDHGWRMSIEPRTPVIVGGSFGSARLQGRLSAFVDYGRTYLIDPLGRAQNTTLLGTGFGMNWTIGSLIDASVVLGFALRETALTKEGGQRLYLNFSAQF